jgi:hypothetical protein
MRTIAALLLMMSVGCTDPYAEAQESDSIEGYEKYLAENPSGAFQLQATSRLEEVMLEKARESQDLADFDAYLARFPTGTFREKALADREDVLFKYADNTDTAAAWQQFIDEYPQGDKKRKQEARRRLKVAQNKDAVSMTAPEIEQTNLQNNPEGALDGWKFFVDVTNNGDKPITLLTLGISYLDDGGNVLDSETYPSVGSRYPGRSWIEDAYKEPLKPGETRTWEYSTGNLPVGWSRKVRIAPVNIAFAEDTP